MPVPVNEKAALVPSGLFDPTLGYPARGPVSRHRRSVGYEESCLGFGAVDGRAGASIVTRRLYQQNGYGEGPRCVVIVDAGGGPDPGG